MPGSVAPPTAGAGRAAIEVVGLAKRYRRWGPGSWRSRRRTDHVALRDVDLRVAPGETVGVLGHNGAGKTTLLRVLGGVTAPSAGTVRVVGRIVPLISIGVGFHNELSGHENVAVNGSLLGLDRATVAARRDEIVAFSELADDVLATPVKLWSSGMQMRLAFSVAMHVDPDVLLVDEVMAVGDMAFQLKCLERMKQLQARGTAIVLVSHSVHAVRLLAPRTIVLEQGALAFDGPSDEAVAAYLALLGERSRDADSDAPVGMDAGVVVDESGRTVHELVHERRYRLRHELHVRRPLDGVRVRFTVLAETGAVAYARELDLAERFAAGERVPLEIDLAAAMAGGTYRMVTTVLDGSGAEVLGRATVLAYRRPRAGAYGIAELAAQIQVDGEDRSSHATVELSGPRPGP
ncbi:MAG: ABC transporter ATP-binding protein [Acidimicrobiia bacterium]